MNIDSVKKALLDAVGNPDSGVFAEWADAIAEAIVDAHDVKKPVKAEVRVVDVEETR